MRDWYDPTAPRPKVDESKLTWDNILSNWDAIETDMHMLYGVDVADGILDRRSWRWFRVRVVRLLAEESMLARALGLVPTAGGKGDTDGRQ